MQGVPKDLLDQILTIPEAESVIQRLADAFFVSPDALLATRAPAPAIPPPEARLEPSIDPKYRTLVEQIPAVIFMINLDRAIGEAYVSPQIEAMLGFTQEEWLEDPVRWYQHIHPEDKSRWSSEAAQLFLSGSTLCSDYRVLARDGRIIWFHCEAKMVRREDGQPWFIHGVAFDITELKRAESALQEERNLASAILDTVSALVVVLDARGRVVRVNRACEHTTGYRFADMRERPAWFLCRTMEERRRFRTVFRRLIGGDAQPPCEIHLATRTNETRLISWSSTTLTDERGSVEYVILTGIDMTESKRLEQAILDISSREQRRIGQDLHDNLGQHLTGIAFMSKVLEQKLAQKSLEEAAEAAKIVALVNSAIHKTRELSHGLLPVVSESRGLMSALERWAAEVEDLYGLRCRFECPDPVLIDDDAAATHLYRIAQEAVNNAIRHGKARSVAIRLAPQGREWFALTVEDDGAGFEEPLDRTAGMGLSIMSYRANMIGGSLRVRPRAEGGTTVTCLFPVKPRRTTVHADKSAARGGRSREGDPDTAGR